AVIRRSWRRLGCGTDGPAGRQLLWRHHTLLHQQRLQRGQPALVVAGVQVTGRWHSLDGVAKLVEVVPPPASASLQREHPALPRCVERGLVSLDLHEPEPVHAAHVVHAVHGSIISSAASSRIPSTATAPNTKKT